MRFLHTADWQIGKPFASIGDRAKRERVRQERIEVVDRIARLAAEHAAEFVLVAGDLFDSTTPERATVSAACAAIGRIPVPVFAIPGNHDHGGPGSVWEQAFFRSECQALAPNFRLLTAPEPVEVNNATILPCPLLRQAEPRDTTAWVRDPVVLESLQPNHARILLAHGSIQSFGSGSDEDGAASNLIDLSRLPHDAIDYVALGDWHGVKQVGPAAWYAGTPELDRFPKGADQQPGHVLLVEVERGRSPQVEALRTARFGWRTLTHDFSLQPEPDALRRTLDELLPRQVGEDLLRLQLAGALGIEASADVAALVESLRARLLDLRLQDETRIVPSEEELRALTEQQQNPLIAEVARQLASRARGEDEDAAVARLALLELHGHCAST